MRALGDAKALPPWDSEREAGAVTVVALYGPRGGYIGDALLGHGQAQALAAELATVLRAADLARKTASAVCAVFEDDYPARVRRTRGPSA